tara:strand:- start:172 stop:1290 length:1119 start_codon:yes stop_codon:yes gene_type:complete
MIFNKMGSNNIPISKIGFGCGIGGYNSVKMDYNTLEDLIINNISLGSNFIDTAPIYGNGESEKIIGALIKPIREKVIIATKISPNNTSYIGVINSLESSLKRLQTDYVDLCQVHWPNPDVPLSETISAMEKLVEDGKIKYIGVSNFTLKEIKETIQHLDKNLLASIQIEYNLFERTMEEELLPFAKKHNITIIAYSPLAQGKLANGRSQLELINNLAKKYDATPSQIVLRFLIDKPEVVAIPNTTKLNRLTENIYSADINIQTEDLDKIDKVCKTEVSSIDTKKIRVSDEYNRKVYTNIEQAKQNKMNMVPSPMKLAAEIKMGVFLKPIRLKKLSKNIEGATYDLIEGRLRYWAWIIAFGWDKPIPSLVWHE